MSFRGHDARLSYQSASSAGLAGHSSKGKESTRNLTEFGAALNMTKFIIGLGIISLPEATKHVGWLSSVIGLGIVAFVTVWGIFFAIQSRYKLERLEEEALDVNAARAVSEGDSLTNPRTGSWQDMTDSGCGFFDRIVGKLFGPYAQCLFATSIAFGQFTTLVVYVIVIQQNVQSYFSDGQADTMVLIGMIFVLGLFSLIPTLQGVAALSALGLSIYAFLFLGLLVELIRKVQTGTLPAGVDMVKPLDSSAGQWFGVSCFAFSGFPIAMVIYEEMIDTRAFYNVVISVFFTCWFVYSAFAMLGYQCYGQNTHTLIYFNFPIDSVFREASAGALACILCFSFVVQAMPVFNCTARAWEQTGLAGKLGATGLPMPLIRWTVLALAIVVAHLIPSVKVMMNTVGAISGVISGFIFPALTYLVLSSRDEWFARCRCCVIVLIGVLGAFYSCTAGLRH